MYVDPKVVQFITEQFIPVRVHVRENADAFRALGARFDAQWTPTILVIDETGVERHRIEGFLPADDLLAQLALGLGHVAFASKDFPTAEQRFRRVVEAYPNSDAAAEALYWAGVARYKATKDASALAETARQFQQRYQGTSWAKKASVWGTRPASVV